MSLDPHHRDPLYKFDTHFPDRLSRHHASVSESPPPAARRTKVMRPRVGVRYRTQPVTFDEIKEVDEADHDTNPGDHMESVKSSLTAFSKSMDGLVSDDSHKGATGFDRIKGLEFNENLENQSDTSSQNPDHLLDNLPMNLVTSRRPKKKNAKQKVAPD